MTRMRFGLIALTCAIGWAAFPDTGTSAPVPKEGTTPYIKWAVNSGPADDGMHDPLVVKDLVVVGTDKGALRAYRTGTGEVVWTYEHGKRIFYLPSSDGERVYFAAYGSVTAVTADAGKKVWSFDLDTNDGPVVAVPAKGVVVATDMSGAIHALDAKTGKKQWSAEFLTDAPPDPPGFDGAVGRIGNTKARPSAMTTDGETLFLSVFDQCRVIAFNATTGKKQWSFQTGGWIFGTAVATATHVFIGSQDECFYCLDKKTGKQVWKFQAKGNISAGCAFDDKYVYFGSDDGCMHCVSQADGKERWRFDVDRYSDSKKSAIYSVPVLRQGAVYFAAGEGQFYAVTADTGTVRGRVRPEEKSTMYCSAATDGRSFFVTTMPSGKGVGATSLVAISLK
jgi:outer membrane protein assembly factor BamB